MVLEMVTKIKSTFSIIKFFSKLFFILKTWFRLGLRLVLIENLGHWDGNRNQVHIFQSSKYSSIYFSMFLKSDLDDWTVTSGDWKSLLLGGQLKSSPHFLTIEFFFILFSFYSSDLVYIVELWLVMIAHWDGNWN